MAYGIIPSLAITLIPDNLATDNKLNVILYTVLLLETEYKIGVVHIDPIL